MPQRSCDNLKTTGCDRVHTANREYCHLLIYTYHKYVVCIYVCVYGLHLLGRVGQHPALDQWYIPVAGVQSASWGRQVAVIALGGASRGCPGTATTARSWLSLTLHPMSSEYVRHVHFR